MNASTTPRFFMSYPRENKSIAVGLMSGLKSLNFDVWMDQAMAPGEDWADRIPKEIEKSHGMVLVCSKHTLRSQWCKSEVRHATQVGLPVWIVRSESMEPPSWMKFCAGGRNYIDLYRGTISQAASDIAESFHNIEDSLQTNTGTAKSDQLRQVKFVSILKYFEESLLIATQLVAVIGVIFNVLRAFELDQSYRPQIFFLFAVTLFNIWLGLRYLTRSTFSSFDLTVGCCAVFTSIPFIGGGYALFVGWPLNGITTLNRSKWNMLLGMIILSTIYIPSALFPAGSLRAPVLTSVALGILGEVAIFMVALRAKLLSSST